MLRTLQIMGIFGRGKEKNSIQVYMKKLQEYQRAEAEILLDMGAMGFEKDDMNLTLECLKKSLKIYQELGDAEKEASILDIIGDIYIQMDDKQNALKYYGDCSDLYSSMDSPNEKDIQDKIAKIDAMEEFKEQSEKDELGKQIPAEGGGEDVDYFEEYGKIFGNLDEVIKLLEESNVYGSYLDGVGSLEHLQESYILSREIGDKKSEALLLLILGDFFLKDNKPKKSMKCFYKALNMFLEASDEKGEAISRLLIGTNCFILGDMEDSTFNYRESIEIFRKLKDQNAESMAIDIINKLSE
jgi:tetratricopeptide (TPR) repeat protein